MMLPLWLIDGCLLCDPFQRLGSFLVHRFPRSSTTELTLTGGHRPAWTSCPGLPRFIHCRVVEYLRIRLGPSPELMHSPRLLRSGNVRWCVPFLPKVRGHFTRTEVYPLTRRRPRAAATRRPYSSAVSFRSSRTS